MFRETARQRAKRIDPEVLRGRPWLERGRVLLAAMAVLAAAGWWGVGMVARRADAWTSPGAVAAVHASWANDCDQCHTDFRPIRADALLMSAGARADMNNKCQVCHAVSYAMKPPSLAKEQKSVNQGQPGYEPLGPFGHHQLKAQNDVADMNCASCHHEHLGTTNMLTRTSDANCTVCHARDDLATAVVPPKHSEVARSSMLDGIKRVTKFSTDGHPYFRSLGEPVLGDVPPAPAPHVRNLKFAQFSHRHHLTAGISEPHDGKPLLTIGQLNRADQDRYRNGNDKDSNELVQLKCASCHEPGNRPATTAVGAPFVAPPQAEGAGAHMLPIVFERHCEACHRLTFEAGANVAGFRQNPKTQEFEPAPTLPHRLDVQQVAEQIDRYCNAEYLREHPEASLRPLPLPGHSFEPGDRAAEQWITKRAHTSAEYVNARCRECHQVERDDGKADVEWTALLPRVKKPASNAPFFVHARFDHAAHRSLEDCRFCHQDADPASAAGSPGAIGGATNLSTAADIGNADASPLMIVNRDTCLQCHAPPAGNGESAHGGARFDCAECHRYHNRQDIAALDSLAPKAANSDVSASRETYRP